MNDKIYRLSYANISNREECDGTIHEIVPHHLFKLNEVEDIECYVLVYEDKKYNKKMVTLLEKRDGELYNIVFRDKTFYSYIFSRVPFLSMESIETLPSLIIHTKTYGNIYNYLEKRKNEVKKNRPVLEIYEDDNDNYYVSLEVANKILCVYTMDEYYSLNINQLRYIEENYKVKYRKISNKRNLDNLNELVINNDKNNSTYVVIKDAYSNLNNIALMNYDNFSKGYFILRCVDRNENEIVFKKARLKFDEYKGIMNYLKQMNNMNFNENMLIDNFNLDDYSFVGYIDESEIKEIYIPISEEDNTLSNKEILVEALKGNRIYTIISMDDNVSKKLKK